MNSQNSDYTMNISLNVLNHLGINLYSNTPAVLAEVIANSWDADATQVNIEFDKDQGTIEITDNGCGMTKEELNKQYLYIGYQRRNISQKTLKGRKPMGRKGIGKLSLFSIADEIHVQSAKDKEKNAFLMDSEKIREHIKSDNPEKTATYHPVVVDYDTNLLSHDKGTAIRIAKLKKNITQATVRGLRKRIARRFSVIDNDEFQVFLNGVEIKYSDRDYFDKARFLFQYGNEDYSRYCNKLDKYPDNNKKIIHSRECRFDEKGDADSKGKYSIEGWIAIAHHSHSLDEGNGEDNLNNIVLAVRGKVAQEDMLHQFRMGAMVTKFIFGEILADFLDDDDDDDISTSGRQSILEDAPRYQALKKFMGKELQAIRSITADLKEKKGVEKALRYHPKIKEWYGSLKPGMKTKANALFGKIEQIDIDEEHRKTLYVNGILAFEKIKMQDALDELDSINPTQLEGLLSIFKEADDIEAAHYYEIVSDRISKIKKLQEITNEDEKERVIQEYIFDHLWLLDPSWERATSEAMLEKTIQVNTINKLKESDSNEVKKMRVDIQYRKVSGAHVIIELKRASRKLKKTELEEQIKKYINGVRDKLNAMDKPTELIEGICIVGKVPYGWDDEKTKKGDMDSLKPLGIKILTYDALIENAYSAYSKFIEKQVEVGKLQQLIQEIRNINELSNAE